MAYLNKFSKYLKVYFINRHMITLQSKIMCMHESEHTRTLSSINSLRLALRVA